MFSNTVIALYALALAGAAAAQAGGLTVATPASIVQCQPASLSWSGGTAPYFPSIIPGSQPGAAALKEFPSQTGTTLVWTVDLAAGTSVTIQVRDGAGGVQYSSALTIQNSSDASCVNASVTGTAPAASGAPQSSAAPDSSAAATPTSAAVTSTAPGSVSGSAPAASSSTRSAASSSAAASSGTAAASPSANAASAVTNGAFGVVAFAGLLGAALF